jgi:hypothetical protein
MATTTASITISSGDLTGDALSLSSTATLTKADKSTGLDQTTGVARKFFASITSAETLVSASEYTADRAHKVYIKNTSTSNSEYINVELGASNITIGRLYGGDWMFIPYNGDQDIDIDTSAVNMTVEYLVIYEA